MPIRETNLVSALDPFKGFVLSAAFFALLRTGLLDDLKQGLVVEEVVIRRGLDLERTTALIDFLIASDLVEKDETSQAVSLTAWGHRLSEARPWYEMMIGGYGVSFLSLSEGLQANSPPVPRIGRYVGSGSCGISLHDSIPLLRNLLLTTGRDYLHLVDLGCGTGVYLTEFCRDYPALTAVGIEPDEHAVEAAREWVRGQPHSDRISIQRADALDWLEQAKDTKLRPDLAILAFVLHEVLAQQGEAGIRQLIDRLFSASPEIDLLVVEVDSSATDRAAMKHPLAQNYYNAYFLLHSFTRQQLMPKAWWEGLFLDCGLTIVGSGTTDASMDSTGFEIAWLLRSGKA